MQCIQVQAYAVNGAGGTKYDINQNILVENRAPDATLLAPDDGAYVHGLVPVLYTLYEPCSGITGHRSWFRPMVGQTGRPQARAPGMPPATTSSTG